MEHIFITLAGRGGFHCAGWSRQTAPQSLDTRLRARHDDRQFEPVLLGRR
jgi:hypothetical protein